MKKNIFKFFFLKLFIFVAFLFVNLSQPALAQGLSENFCYKIYSTDNISTINPNDVQSNLAKYFAEHSLITVLRNKPVPIVKTNVAGKDLDITLVNLKTYPSISPLFENSIGIIVNHQPGYRNDHGMFRLGDMLIDRDLPGARNRGEINLTGISWVGVHDFILNTSDSFSAHHRIEVLFKLTPEEYRVASAYHKMRRAGIVRPDFNFGAPNNPKHLNNRLEDCGEMCFSFSTGSATYSQAMAIKMKIQEYEINITNKNITNIDAFLLDPEIQEFITKAENLLIDSSEDYIGLNPRMFDFISPPKIYSDTTKYTLEFINWIVGYSVTKKYHKLLTDLEIYKSTTYSNIESPRASAVLIYDNKVSFNKFISKDYKSDGVFSIWSHENSTVIQSGH